MIAHHYTVNSGLMEVCYEHPLSVRSLYYFIFGAWGKTGINCFVIITGYFMCERELLGNGERLRGFFLKWIRLFSEMMFYRILFQCLFWISGYEPVTVTGLIKMAVPWRSIEQNFTGCFLTFYMFIPFLILFVRQLTELQHRTLVFLSLFMYTLFGTLPGLSVSMNYVSWYMVLFLIGSYARLRPMKPFWKKKDGTSHNIWDDRRLWGTVSAISIGLQVLSIIAMAWLGVVLNRRQGAHYFVSDCNSLLCLTTGTATFLFFKNLKIPYNPLINRIAASTFGVLLIHANSDTMRQFLWKDIFHNAERYSMGGSYWWLYPIIVVVFVFASATLVDMARIRFLEEPWMKRIENLAKRKA